MFALSVKGRTAHLFLRPRLSTHTHILTKKVDRLCTGSAQGPEVDCDTSEGVSMRPGVDLSPVSLGAGTRMRGFNGERDTAIYPSDPASVAYQASRRGNALDVSDPG